MDSLFALVAYLGDVLLAVFGFGLIIFLHELGHFVAARWAGIRVLAFAIGFGPALVTFRKGLGLRRGSSEREYFAWLNREAAGATSPGYASQAPAVSPTEYRLNVLPLGGYVKMLGQDDLDPTAVSSAPDSYQSCRPWKRMVVISAGVVMNLITAAALFVLVFMVGLRTEPATIGEVVPGLAASKAVAVNGAELGVTRPGLMPGDVVLTIDGEKPNSFNDLSLATAMAERSATVELLIRREGVAQPLRFEVKPEEGALSRLLEIGVDPARSPRVLDVRNATERAEGIKGLAKIGLSGVEPGMTLVSAGDISPVRGAEDLARAVRQSGGRPVPIGFKSDDGRAVSVTVQPSPQLQNDQVKRPSGEVVIHRHLLGLTPVMKVGSAAEAQKRGLLDGDVFVRLGTAEYPSITQGIAEIQASAGKTIDLVVARKGEDGAWTEVPLSVGVDRKGRIGFFAGDTSDQSTLLALPPTQFTEILAGAKARTPAASQVITRPGMRVVAVDGTPVGDFGELRAALVEATKGALEDGLPEARVKLALELPIGRTATARPVETVEWTIAAADIKALHELGWVSPIDPGIFKPEETTLKAQGPAEALRMGLEETHRVMMQTYLTFARVFQGTVKVEHLKGPVGIVHIGARVADRGLIWLLFLMALISVNLAVVNFLPLPIVDGGLFLFLVFEQVRGKPVSVAVQNATTVVGLILIGSLFLVVTFNDIMGIFGR